MHYLVEISELGYLPGGYPLSWQNETSGVLALAVNDLFSTTNWSDPFENHTVSVLKKYLRYYMNAPIHVSQASIFGQVDELTTRGDFFVWLDIARGHGLEPFKRDVETQEQKGHEYVS